MRLQLVDLGMEWPRYDTIRSLDDRNMNLKETCPGLVKTDVDQVVKKTSFGKTGQRGMKMDC